MSWVPGTQRSKPGLPLAVTASMLRHPCSHLPLSHLEGPKPGPFQHCQGPHDLGWHEHALWGSSPEVTAPSPYTWAPAPGSLLSQQASRRVTGQALGLKGLGPAFCHPHWGLRAPAGLVCEEEEPGEAGPAWPKGAATQHRRLGVRAEARSSHGGQGSLSPAGSCGQCGHSWQAYREEALLLRRGGLKPAVLCLWVLHLLNAGPQQLILQQG